MSNSKIIILFALIPLAKEAYTLCILRKAFAEGKRLKFSKALAERLSKQGNKEAAANVRVAHIKNVLPSMMFDLFYWAWLFTLLFMPYSALYAVAIILLSFLIGWLKYKARWFLALDSILTIILLILLLLTQIIFA